MNAFIFKTDHAVTLTFQLWRLLLYFRKFHQRTLLRCWEYTNTFKGRCVLFTGTIHFQDIQTVFIFLLEMFAHSLQMNYHWGKCVSDLLTSMDTLTLVWTAHASSCSASPYQYSKQTISAGWLKMLANLFSHLLRLNVCLSSLRYFFHTWDEIKYIYFVLKSWYTVYWEITLVWKTWILVPKGEEYIYKLSLLIRKWYSR